MVTGNNISQWRFLAQSQVDSQTRREACLNTSYGKLHSFCLLPHLHSSSK